MLRRIPLLLALFAFAGVAMADCGAHDGKEAMADQLQASKAPAAKTAKSATTKQEDAKLARAKATKPAEDSPPAKPLTTTAAVSSPRTE